MRLLAVCVMVLIALCSCAASDSSTAGSSSATGSVTALAAQPEPAAPTASSLDPVGVGIMRIVVTDPARDTAARPPLPASTSRRLALSVRYPIDAPAAVTESADAAPRGRWPLVVFAHGFDVSADTYAPLLHAIAASGFVVVAPEFPLSSSTLDAPALEGDEPQQARDVNFLIDLFTGANAPPPFDRAVAPKPVGIMGHSDGAQTVLLSGYAPAYRDPRIGAVVAVSGRYSAFGGRWFGAGAPALLVLQASADELNPFSSGIELVQKDPHPAMLVAVDGVSHLGAVTDPSAVPQVARLIADTFAARLLADSSAEQRVAPDVSQPPLRLVDSHEG
jgi:predicted dienelactone hydrolase